MLLTIKYLVGVSHKNAGFPHSKWLKHATLLTETLQPTNPLDIRAIHLARLAPSFGKQ